MLCDCFVCATNYVDDRCQAGCRTCANYVASTEGQIHEALLKAEAEAQAEAQARVQARATAAAAAAVAAATAEAEAAINRLYVKAVAAMLWQTPATAKGYTMLLARAARTLQGCQYAAGTFEGCHTTL